MLTKSNTPTTATLHWTGPDFRVQMASDHPCPHCFRPLHPSDVRRDPGAVALICGHCHHDVWRVELQATD
jgi:hypothetical protein